MSAAELKREVDAVERRYRGQRYPTELRERLIEYARGRREHGASWTRIGAEVGVRGPTLRRWCGAEVDPLVPVRVVGPSGVAVVSPAGWRVEGLSAAEAAAFIRAMS